MLMPRFRLQSECTQTIVGDDRLILEFETTRQKFVSKAAGDGFDNYLPETMDSSSDEEVNVDKGSFEGEFEGDVFAETIQLIESNAEELDAQVLDSIAEVKNK